MDGFSQSAAKKQAFLHDFVISGTYNGHMTQKTLVIMTGGTIDAYYNPAKGTPHNVPLDGSSPVPEVVRQLGYGDRCDMVQLACHDSKSMSHAEMEKILHYIMEHDAEYDRIVITHGTDTMPHNGRYLQELLCYTPHDKTIIFTGSMEPLRDDKKQLRAKSDGWGNLRAALELVDITPSGVYIVMSGQLYHVDAVDKVVETDQNGDKAKVVFSKFVPRDPKTPDIGLIER